MEFARIENLLGRIDQSLSAGFSVEPSPQLLANVRQSIAAEPQPSRRWLTRNVWLSAAGVCAAVAVLLLILLPHRPSRSVANFAPHAQITNSARETIPAQPARAAAAPSRSASAENVPPRAPARGHSSRPRLSVARQELPRNPHRHNTEPEVIVQPGQMQAILQFVAETRNGKINGAEIENGVQAAEKPLEIKPLEIAPLETSAGDTNGGPAGKGRVPGSSDGRSE